MSNVDIAWLPILYRAAIVKKHTNFDFLSGKPKIQAWQSNLLKTELAEKTVSRDFEQLFIGFYLTNTLLATGEDVDQNNGCSSNNCCG